MATILPYLPAKILHNPTKKLNSGFETIKPGNYLARSAMMLAIGLLALVALPTMALAGGHATLLLGPDHIQMRIEWLNDSTARFDMPAVQGTSGYTLLLDGKLYIVSNGQVMPANMITGMFAGRSGAGGKASQADATPTLTGPLGSETIAGIRGSVYRAKWPATLNNGPARPGQFKDIVLTDNDLVRQMTKVWIANAAAMGNGKMRDSNALKNVFGNRGVLRAGNDMRVAKIDGTMPPSSDFVLPKGSFAGMSSNGQGSSLLGTLKNAISDARQQQSSQGAGSRAGKSIINNLFNKLLGN